MNSLKFSKLKKFFLRIYFLLPGFLFLGRPKTVYIFSLHAAGDLILSSKAINLISQNFVTSNVVLVLSRPEVLSLARVWFPQIASISLDSFCLRSINRSDFIVNLTGPSYYPAFYSIKFSLRFVGFINNFSFTTNVFLLKFRLWFFPSFRRLSSHHIARNNLIAHLMFPSTLVDISKQIFVDPSIQNLTNSRCINSTVTLFLPQNKLNKSYPKHLFLILLEQLLCLYPIVLLRHASDKPLSETTLLNNPNLSEVVFDDWSSLLMHLRSSRLVVTSDSVVYHITSAFNIPFVAIFGNTKSAFYRTDSTCGIHLDLSSTSSCYSGSLSSPYCNLDYCNPYCLNMLSVMPHKIVSAVKSLLL